MAAAPVDQVELNPVETNVQQKSCCSVKCVAKFCLLYLVCLLVLLIIFTAFYHEPMTSKERGWWWGFLVSLLLSTSFCLTSLVILVYSDYYKASGSSSNQDGAGAAVDVEQAAEMAAKSPMEPQNSQSASYKTILTINSAPSSPVGLLETTRPDSNFQNMTTINKTISPTPTKNGRLTVVDLTTVRKQRGAGGRRQKLISRTALPAGAQSNKMADTQPIVSTLNKDTVYKDDRKRKKRPSKERNKMTKRKK